MKPNNYLDRRIEYFLRKADVIEDSVEDIYDAPIEKFRKWKYFLNIAAELMVTRQKLSATL